MSTEKGGEPEGSPLKLIHHKLSMVIIHFFKIFITFYAESHPPFSATPDQ